MKTFYYLAVLILFVFSCNNTDKKKDDANFVTEIVERTESEKIEKAGFLTVISKTDIKSPFLISTEKNFNNLQSYQHYLYDKSDTLKIKIQPYQFIEVHNKYAYADSLIVKQGDTLVLSYVNDSLVKEIHNKSKYQAKRFSYKSIADTTFLNYLDAFVSKYFVIDYTNPLELENDNSKIRLYRTKANQDRLSGAHFLE